MVQEVLKRKQRDELDTSGDDAESRAKRQHTHSSSSDAPHGNGGAASGGATSGGTKELSAQPVNPSRVPNTSAGPSKRGDCSVAQLRFATESWQGMKPSNEDRHVTDTTRFPGPVFGVFDGHGGVFTVELLVRNLLKNTSSSIKQHVQAREIDALETLRSDAEKEAKRKREIETQLELFTEQLAQVKQIMDDGTPPAATPAAVPARVHGNDEGNGETKALCEQLQSIVRDMQEAIAQIDSEDEQRREQLRTWLHRQDPHFKRAFTESFQRTDAQVVQKNPSRDGSTALLLWFVGGGGGDTTTSNPGELAYYTINLGDCRAVLCRGGHGIPLTADHKPSRPDEKQRIVDAGGFVGTFAGIARVYSATGAGLSVQQQPESATYLAVSRAFGDRPLKVPTALVSCEPEIKRFSVESEDLFIVVACDGIWDVLSNQDAVNIGLAHFQDAQKAADAIVKEAYKRGSSDNLTATVVQFGWQDGTSQLKQAQANSSSNSSSSESRNGIQQQHKASPRFLQRAAPVHPRVASILNAADNSEAAAALAAMAGETTENQEDDDEEDEEEIDMFNL